MNLFSTKVAYAASTSLNEFIANVDSAIINPLIALLFALAVVYFLYGVFKFIANQDNEEKRTEGRKHMIYGIIGITIMMGVFFIMNLLLNTLGINYVHPEQGTVDTLPK